MINYTIWLSDAVQLMWIHIYIQFLLSTEVTEIELANPFGFYEELIHNGMTVFLPHSACVSEIQLRLCVKENNEVKSADKIAAEKGC